MRYLPTMYALDEHGPWLAAHPREVSEFSWDPGVPAVLDMTEPGFPERRVLLDVDTLRIFRVSRAELEGKPELTYDRDRVRRHIERLVAEYQSRRGRYNTKVTAIALRRLAAGGAKSSWPQVGERLHPSHPLENSHWIRAVAKPQPKKPKSDVLRWPGSVREEARREVKRMLRASVAAGDDHPLSRRPDLAKLLEG